MGGMLSQPVTNKSSDEGQGLGLRYGLSSMQGWRPEMEDAHDVKIGLRYGLNDWSFFAVFDGHAGKCAAAFAAWNLLEYILRDNEFDLEKSSETPLNELGFMTDETSITPNKDEVEDKTNGLEAETINNPNRYEKSSLETKTLSPDVLGIHSEETQQLSPKPTDSYEKTNEIKPKFTSMPEKQQLEMVKKAIRSGFLTIDQTMRTSAQDMSGCTAVCVLISPSHLFIANCGDSRAVLYDGENTSFATIDHKPFNPGERIRIIRAGGTATQRINGTLAVSRALGDFEFKKDSLRGPTEQLVSPVPDVTVITRRPDKDEFIILACDGIWDVINNEDLCKYIRHKLRLESSLEKICSSVLDVCLHKGSRDNMSVIIVVFDKAPKVDEEAIAAEKKNDTKLLELLDAFQDKHNDEDFSSFITGFDCYLGPNSQLLPPGARIEGKYDLLRERFEENMKKYSDQDVE